MFLARMDRYNHDLGDEDTDETDDTPLFGSFSSYTHHFRKQQCSSRLTLSTSSMENDELKKITTPELRKLDVITNDKYLFSKLSFSKLIFFGICGVFCGAINRSKIEVFECHRHQTRIIYLNCWIRQIVRKSRQFISIWGSRNNKDNLRWKLWPISIYRRRLLMWKRHPFRHHRGRLWVRQNPHKLTVMMSHRRFSESAKRGIPGKSFRVSPFPLRMNTAGRFYLFFLISFLIIKRSG